jgi:PiT family inorganic phosphate transporter
MMEWIPILAAVVLAFANGANDNFKGFATVWGSETLAYRPALLLATIATVAGSIASLWMADALAQQFSGNGLVPSRIVNNPLLITSVLGGAAGTVLLATRLGLPVSTTHALIGGLVGAGFAQSGGEAVHLDKLTSTFITPLLVSPLLAAGLGITVTRLFSLRQQTVDCACIVKPSSQCQADGTLVLATPTVILASEAGCEVIETSVKLSAPRIRDRLHIASAMSVCFARAVNDTPKLAALLVGAQLFGSHVSFTAIAAAMALGGVLFARRVAQTLSQRVTRMNHSLGFSANLITALLVLFASKLGLPVSTTHVTVGAIAGAGLNAGILDWTALRNILLSWVATLPLATGLAWGIGRIV